RAWSMDVPIGTPVAGGHVVTLIVLVSGSTHVFHDWYYEIQPATSGTPRPAPGVFEVSRPAPDPFRAACSFRIRLRTAAAAVMTVLDAVGRAIHREPLGVLPVGDSTVRWDGSGATRAGLYFVRLHVGGHLVTRRVVRLGAV